MTSWKKSNVLPQITSLSLLAVNFLPCASTLQINAEGTEYPFFPLLGLNVLGSSTLGGPQQA